MRTEKTRNRNIFQIFAIIFCLLLAWGNQAHATARALLIGVSGYPGYPLQAPRRDVGLIYHLLTDRGFAASDIQVLADSPADAALVATAGLPTRKAIMGALAGLVENSQSGDFVIIYYSGHGSRQPTSTVSSSASIETDGLDEIILPLDIGSWNDANATVENAIVDDEIGFFVDQLRDRGAFVWVIVDACHSATVTRGAGDEYAAVRAIDPLDLGIPLSRLAAAEKRSSATSLADPLIPHRSDKGGVVVFSAAAESQKALETNFPREYGGVREPHGLLTWSLAEGLARRPSANFRQLAQMVLAGYEAYRSNPVPSLPPAPTPYFEGNLDRFPLAASVAANGWPVSPIAGDGREFSVAAGVLHGVSEGMEVRLMAPPERDPIAHGRIVAAGVATSRFQLSAPLDSRFSDTVLFIEPVTPRIDLTLRVAFAPEAEVSASDRSDGAAVRAAVEKMRMSEYRRLPVDVVAPDAAPDVLLLVRDRRLWILTQRAVAAASFGSNEVPGSDISGFAFHPNGTTTWGHSRTASVPISDDATQFGAQIESKLLLVAAYRNLLRITQTLAGSPAGKDFSADVFVRRHQQAENANADASTEKCTRAPETLPSEAIPMALGAATELHHCDAVFIRLENRGPDPIDLTIAYFDGDFGISIPRRAAPGIRLTKDQPPVVIGFSVAAWLSGGKPAAIGPERLVLLGVVRHSEEEWAEPAFFGTALEQPSLGSHASAEDITLQRSAHRTAQRATLATTRSISGVALDDLLAKATSSTLLRAAGGGRLADLNQSFAVILPWEVKVGR